MGNVYWSIVVLLFGGCIGSFLNVVIYRWSRDLSVRHPARSFCPNCNTTLTWYDNIPVISYIFLRGRCRTCRVPISLQYPLVELATAWVFLITFDAFFVARQRIGIGDLSTDWPMLAAHWILWAGLIALSVMDLEAYVVDIRVTWIVSVVGILAHTLWTPPSSRQWIRPGTEGAALAIAATVGLVLGYLLFLRRQPALQLDEPEFVPDSTVSLETDAVPVTATSPPRLRWLYLLICVALLAVYWSALLSAAEQPPFRGIPRLMTLAADAPLARSASHDVGMLRLVAGLAIVFLGLAAAASQPHAEADVEIVEAIAAEAPAARATAFRELMMLSPAVLLAIATLFLLGNQPPFRSAMTQAMAWKAAGDWQPLLGLSTGLLGWVIGGTIGWLARIIFTLLFGKEALGPGDIHILAAAGAIAGWPVAFLGFFLAAPLTLLALAVIHFRRQSRALPYGPWLAMAFLIAAVFQDRILIYLGVRWMLEPLNM